jgi:hypothetical protein
VQRWAHSVYIEQEIDALSGTWWVMVIKDEQALKSPPVTAQVTATFLL